MKTILRFLYSFSLSLFICSCTAQTTTNLSADEFEKGITKDSIQILDVRTPGEYSSGHIKNTLLANWNDPKEFDRRVAFIDKNKPVFVYCLAGGRSAAAAEKMRSIGFTKVYELKGGINAWKAANKNLEGATTTKQMSIAEFNTAINSSKTVLVDFGATWCPPCKTMEPVLQSLQKNNAGKFTLLKVDGGNDQTILKQYQVTALPVFIVFKNGKEVWRKDGVAEEKEIAAHL
ncbi:thioredoxin domain-containing protein [Ferruginibacter sp. SUN106]|uniref:thioredoxin domain-containing protein n=1 Tax=Ferruginibacter sp. SUN106 TaxID=2978348 RepID=UPI003D36A5DD